ncbi:hypothetical protein [Rickettsia tamurae]|uniref:hypothetical protein n=1 Tax=Rickettsia tamurae TaxID=334545 RepID=UPI001BFD6720|nr:hypothetical protein [Rickettsia tamurae]
MFCLCHCKKNCIAIDEARKRKNSVNQNFFIIFWGSATQSTTAALLHVSEKAFDIIPWLDHHIHKNNFLY